MKTTLEMAKQVSAEGFAPVMLHPEVRRLCELVRADEREACAKVCEPQEEHDDPLTAWKIAAAIRARSNT